MDALPVMRWLDRNLIMIIKNFCQFEKGKSHTFQMCDELQLMP